MIHARPDYNRINPDPALHDPSLLGEGCTPIAEDEPVCLFRAQDKHFISVLKAYRRQVCADSGGDVKKREAIVESIDQHIKLSECWQAEHGVKSPDLPTPAVMQTANPILEEPTIG